MTTNANATITCTIDGHEVSGTIDVILSILGNRTPDQTPTQKPAPKADPKPKAAPKAAPKAETAAPVDEDAWYLGIVTSPWVKEYECKPKSSIVKVRPKAGHGAELRTAGFRPMKGNQWWWAEKDEAKAKAKGERYLANKAARVAKTA